MTPEAVSYFLSGPALGPPAGTSSDFSPDRHSALAYGVIITCSLITLIAFTARIASRFLNNNKNNNSSSSSHGGKKWYKRIFTTTTTSSHGGQQLVLVEDVLLVFAFGLYVAFQWVMYSYGIWPGVLVHQWDLQLAYSPEVLFHIGLGAVFFGLCIMFLKVAILLDWLRVFLVVPPHSHSHGHGHGLGGKKKKRFIWKIKDPLYWTAHFLIWANVIFYLISTVLMLYLAYECIPWTEAQLTDILYSVPETTASHPTPQSQAEFVRQSIDTYGLWALAIGPGSNDDGTCPVNTGAATVASGVVNLVSDLAILALPQKVIWGLQMKTTRKLGISLLFAVGIFACACAVARLVYVVRNVYTWDQTYFLGVMGFWCMGEMTAAFLIIGLPCLPKVWQVLMPKSLRQSFAVKWSKISSSSSSNSDSDSSGKGSHHHHGGKGSSGSGSGRSDEEEGTPKRRPDEEDYMTAAERRERMIMMHHGRHDFHDDVTIDDWENSSEFAAASPTAATPLKTPPPPPQPLPNNALRANTTHDMMMGVSDDVQPGLQSRVYTA